MFVGATPNPVLEQITRIVPFESWRQVFVGCSGSFRFERALKVQRPEIVLHSNDVSLLSYGVGALAIKAAFPLTFTACLAFIEKRVAAGDFRRRMAAVLGSVLI